MKLLSRVRLFATPWTVAHQAPPSVGFSRQEYWSGLPFPSSGIFPTQGSKPGLPHCRQMLSHQGSPRIKWDSKYRRLSCIWSYWYSTHFTNHCQCPLTDFQSTVPAFHSEDFLSNILESSFVFENCIHLCLICSARILSCVRLVCDPMDCSPSGSFVHEIFQATVLEWIASFSSRAFSQSRDWTCISWVSCMAGRFFPTEPRGKRSPQLQSWP